MRFASELFEHDGAGAAAAVADGGDAPLPRLLEGAGQVGGDAGAGGAQRVTQADGPAVDVHLGENQGCLILDNRCSLAFILFCSFCKFAKG